jgi:hypothetical protein
VPALVADSAAPGAQGVDALILLDPDWLTQFWVFSRNSGSFS